MLCPVVDVSSGILLEQIGLPLLGLYQLHKASWLELTPLDTLTVLVLESPHSVACVGFKNAATVSVNSHLCYLLCVWMIIVV